MGTLMNVISGLCGVVNLVCFIIVIVQMFKQGQTGWGIGCLVGVLFCFIGVLVAFILGWVKASEWEIQPVMLAWTASWVIGLLTGVMGGFAMVGGL